MKTGQCVVEAVARHVRDRVVELSQHRPYFMGVLRALDFVVRFCTGDLRDGPPVVAVIINKEVLSIPCRNDLWKLPNAVCIQIILLCLINFMDMFRDTMYVLHELIRFLEDIRVDPLNDSP